MTNPTWYETLPTPYNEEYPNWDSLPTLTNAEVKDELWKIGCVYITPDIYSFSAPSRGANRYKIPPLNRVQAFWDHQPDFIYRLPWAGSAGIAYCMTMAQRGLEKFEMWCANIAAFHATGTLGNGISHAINLVLTIDGQGIIQVVSFDFTGFLGGGTIQTNIHDVWPLGQMWTRPY